MHSSRIVLDLPFPPSINHYYIRTKFGVTIGAKGKDFRKEAVYLCSKQALKSEHFSAEKRLFVSVAIFPPDRRKRDLDNCLKATLDSLTHAQIYVDDCQIDHLECIRKTRQSGDGRVIVTIEELESVASDDTVAAPAARKTKKSKRDEIQNL